LKYNLVGGFSFYERAEVKDLLAYLKAAANPQDTISLLRIINSPPRGIGQTTTKRLEEIALESNISLRSALDRSIEAKAFPPRTLVALAAFRDLMIDLEGMIEAGNVPEMLTTVLERTHYEDRLKEDGTPDSFERMENIHELQNAATDSFERGEHLREFLDHAALVSDSDSFDEQALITLMTLHSAKGLEFPVVILGGLEEGLLPHSRSLLNEQALEEERRLCYVGMTRARDILILTRAEARRYYGDQMLTTSRPSRFWSEIPEHLLQDASGRPASRAASQRVASPGERIYEYDTPEPDEKELRRKSIGNVRRYFNVETAARESSDESPSPSVSSLSQGPRGDSGRWPLGCRVRHSKYGYGTLLHREGAGEEAKVTVSFPGFGVKKLVEKFANLVRV
jgi:ATP-dependent DNA helicase UvrD/PcrA